MKTLTTSTMTNANHAPTSIGRQACRLGAVLIAAFSGAAANASVITGTNNGGGGGGLFVNSSSVATPNPGNNNVLGLSTNTLSYNETFNNVNYGSATYANAQGPPTEYTVSIAVLNNTGVNWIGFECYTGSGTIIAPSYLNWFVFDFDLAPTISGPGTGGATWSPLNDNWITFSNLNVPAGATISMTFNLDLPVNTFGSWAIQQRPIAIPAPGSLALLGLGGLVATRRRR